jgi:hypothetical protein
MVRVHGSGERWPYAEMLLEMSIGRDYRYGSRAAVPATSELGQLFDHKQTTREHATIRAVVESRGGISPPRAPKTVREPLDSHGSRCSAVSMT